MKIKRLNGKYCEIAQYFETTSHILYKNRYIIDFEKLINKDIIYYFLSYSNHYTIELYIIKYDEENEEYYSEYITEFSQNTKNILSKSHEKIVKIYENY